MRTITVCVDYHDLLAITLPYNRHHFESMFVVTDHKHQAETEAAAFRPLTQEQRCGVVVLATDLFYQDGAAFNKFRALEWGLDQMGRSGWLCLLDADILWPRFVPPLNLEVGKLYAPLRRMMPNPGPIPPLETNWRRFPIHRNVHEWAGCSLVFHADDPALGPPPWHDVDWTHAGGADSFFQAKWGDMEGWRPGLPQRNSRKVRLPFEVLHLGPPGVNWFGRASPRLDGSVPEGAEERVNAYLALWPERRARQSRGLDPFLPEKIRPENP